MRGWGHGRDGQRDRQIDRGGQRDKKGTEGGRDRDILKMPQRPTQGSAIFEDPVGHLGTPGEGRGDSRSHDDPKEKDSQAHGNAGTKQDRIPRVSALLIGPQGQARLPVDWGGRGGQPRPPSHHPALASRPPSPPAHSAAWTPPTSRCGWALPLLRLTLHSSVPQVWCPWHHSRRSGGCREPQANRPALQPSSLHITGAAASPELSACHWTGGGGGGIWVVCPRTGQWGAKC